MDDIIPLSSLPFPIKAKASASASYNRSHETVVYDSKVYPPCTNKIEEIGLIKKRKLSIICDGQGKMNIKEVRPHQKTRKIKKSNEARFDYRRRL